jgi:hypothetical protein
LHAGTIRNRHAILLEPLKGKSTKTGATIDLHPGTVDNNVELLIGRGDEDVIRGTWQLVTDAGVEATGPIELVASPKGKP